MSLTPDEVRAQNEMAIKTYLNSNKIYSAKFKSIYQDMDIVSNLKRDNVTLQALYNLTDKLCTYIRSINSKIDYIHEMHLKSTQLLKSIKKDEDGPPTSVSYYQTSTRCMDTLRWVKHNGVLSIKMIYELKSSGNAYDDDKYDELVWIYRDMCHVCMRLLFMFETMTNDLVDNLRTISEITVHYITTKENNNVHH